MIRSLLFVAVACSACGGAPKPIPTAPESGVTVDDPSPPTTKVAACLDGKFIPPGGRMRVDYHLLGTAHAAGGARATAVLTGVCSVSKEVYACLKTTREQFVGNASFELTVADDGKATVKLVGEPAIDSEVATCIEQRLSSVVFAKEAIGVTRYDLDLRKGLGNVKIVEQGTKCEGIDSVSARRTLRSNFPRLRTCYEHFIHDRGFVDGSLVFDIGIRPDGSVANVNVDFSQTFNHKSLLDCMAGVVSAVRFEAPEQPAKISYALTFHASASE